MVYYIKQSGFILVYTIIFSILAFLMAFIDVPWVIIASGAFILVGFMAILGLLYYMEGREARKTLYANDLERIHIINTGADIKLDEHKEYRPYKGFVIGLIGTIPLFLLLLLHTIVFLSTGNDVFGFIAGLLYNCFYNLCYAVITAPSGLNYFYLAYALPVIPLSAGVGYLIGGRVQQKTYDKAEEVAKKIYEEKNAKKNVNDGNGDI